MNARNITKTAASIALAATAAFGAANPAMAGNACKDVQLEFQNNRSTPIKIIDVDYWDPSKGRNGGWRSEPIRNAEIAPGDPWRDTRNLERVNHRQTKVRFEYRIKNEDDRWSWRKYSRITELKLCTTRENFEVESHRVD